MATENRTALDTLYFVDDSDKDISLELITGGINQTSTLTVGLEDSIIVADRRGNLPQQIIGTNSTINGKVLSIVCTIADTSRDTNFTELRVRLNGGILFMEFPLFATVENEGDSVSYTCIIKFFKP